MSSYNYGKSVIVEQFEDSAYIEQVAMLSKFETRPPGKLERRVSLTRLGLQPT